MPLGDTSWPDDTRVEIEYMCRVLLVISVACSPVARTPPPPKPAAGPSFTEMLSSLAVGQSTKSEVRAALGEGTEVSFDSGYEVWVYRAAAR